MTLGERIKEVRTSKGLTLEKFGACLGMKKAGLSKIENGQVNVTDAVIKSICREFSVDELWLRTGVGEPFRERSEAEEMAALFGSTIRTKASDMKALFNVIERTTPEEWKIMKKKILELAAELQKTNEKETDP